MRASFLILTLVSLAACSGDLTLPGEGPEGPDGPPLPDQVRIVDGDGQRARTGELLNDPLVVQVVDSGAAPVVGSTVEFSFAGDPAGAVLEPSVATTDASGLASVEVRVGLESGEQEVVARVSGTDLSASFTVTATSGRGHGHGGDEND